MRSARKTVGTLSRDLQRQRVDSTNQVLAQSVMHGPVPFDPVHRFESIRSDRHLKMALDTFTIPRVTPMFLTLIHDHQLARLKSCPQFVAHFVFNSHFSPLTPSILRRLV